MISIDNIGERRNICNINLHMEIILIISRKVNWIKGNSYEEKEGEEKLYEKTKYYF